MRQKGAITVFLSMTFLIVLALVFSVVESARMQAVRMLAETAADACVESLFAGYQRELYDKYDVLLFDGGDGKGNISEAQIASKMNGYIQYFLHPDMQTLLKNTDFYRLSCKEITCNQVVLATDDNGMVFRDCAINYVRTFLGQEEIQKLTGKYDWVIQNVEKEQTYRQKESEAGEAIRGLEEEKSRIDKEKAEEAQTAGSHENPALRANDIRSVGILNLVCQDTSKISQKAIVANQVPSGRKLFQGNGFDKYEEGVTANVLFQSYLMRKFRHATYKDTYEGDNLAYQLEYLLIGKEHDVDNLKGVVERLLLLREGANFTYLLSDAGKVAEAYSMAMLLVGYTCLPPLIEATKYGILLAWAYAESVLDVRVLLAGEKCAMVKTAGTWKTAIGNIGEVASMDPKQMSDKSGISYAEYLQMLLMVANQKELAMRALDIMEMEVRSLTKNNRFRIDCCVAMLEAKMRMVTKSVFLELPFMKNYTGWKEKELQVVRNYSYIMW